MVEEHAHRDLECLAGVCHGGKSGEIGGDRLIRSTFPCSTSFIMAAAVWVLLMEPMPYRSSSVSARFSVLEVDAVVPLEGDLSVLPKGRTGH